MMKKALYYLCRAREALDNNHKPTDMPLRLARNKIFKLRSMFDYRSRLYTNPILHDTLTDQEINLSELDTREVYQVLLNDSDNHIIENIVEPAFSFIVSVYELPFLNTEFDFFDVDNFSDDVVKDCVYNRENVPMCYIYNKTSREFFLGRGVDRESLGIKLDSRLLNTEGRIDTLILAIFYGVTKLAQEYYFPTKRKDEQFRDGKLQYFKDIKRKMQDNIKEADIDEMAYNLLYLVLSSDAWKHVNRIETYKKLCIIDKYAIYRQHVLDQAELKKHTMFSTAKTGLGKLFAKKTPNESDTVTEQADSDMQEK